MRLLPLRVDGVAVTPHTVAPLFTLDPDGTLGARPPGVELTDDPRRADRAALVCLWGAHDAHRRAATTAVDRAATAGLEVVVWVDGDLEVDLDRPGVVLYEQGAEAGRRRRHAEVRAWPVLIHDHLADRFGGEVEPVPRGPAPTVGFCGQATAPPTGQARLAAGKAAVRARHATGRSDRLAAPWASHLRLRRRVLDRLGADDRVTTDFVVRDRYRAGVRDPAARAGRADPTATEFFANIRANAYTVCVRGGGNFSTRLYETLCLGRIPVLVDTGLVLPWADRVRWADHAVVVPAGALDEVGDRVVAHHRAHDDDRFAEAQRACRALWADWLSVPGYFSRLGEAWAARA